MGSRIDGPWQRRGGWRWEWRSMWQWLEFLRRTKNEDERGVDGVLQRDRGGKVSPKTICPLKLDTKKRGGDCGMRLGMREA